MRLNTQIEPIQENFDDDYEQRQLNEAILLSLKQNEEEEKKKKKSIKKKISKERERLTKIEHNLDSSDLHEMLDEDKKEDLKFFGKHFLGGKNANDNSSFDRFNNLQNPFSNLFPIVQNKKKDPPDDYNSLFEDDDYENKNKKNHFQNLDKVHHQKNNFKNIFQDENNNLNFQNVLKNDENDHLINHNDNIDEEERLLEILEKSRIEEEQLTRKRLLEEQEKAYKETSEKDRLLFEKKKELESQEILEQKKIESEKLKLLQEEQRKQSTKEQRELELKLGLEKKLKNLKNEPTENFVAISVKFPDNSTFNRKFSLDDRLSDLRNW